MEQGQEKKSNLNIPIAIIIGGVLIAGAIFMRDSKIPSSTDGLGAEEDLSGDSNFSFEPLSAKDHILGNPKSPIILFEYSDFDCPFCRDFHSTLNTILDVYGKDAKLAWVYRHFPLYKPAYDGRILHPNAGTKAEASECATDQYQNDGFWKFADAIFKGPSAHGKDVMPELLDIARANGFDVIKFEECLKDKKYSAFVEEQYNNAFKAGGRGTPYNVLALNQKLSEDQVKNIRQIFTRYPQNPLIINSDLKSLSLSGALPLEQVKQVIDIILEK